MSTNKKLFILLLTIFLISAVSFGAYFLINYYTARDIKQNSQDFVSKWGNFKDEASIEYRNSFKPMVSDAIFNDYANNSAELIAARGDTPPSTSTFTNIEVTEVKKDKKIYYVTATGERKYSFSDQPIKQTVHLKWEKVDGNYLITDVYTDG